jgi:hypothetical protein
MLAAQICGTSQEPLLERIDVNKRNMIELQRGAQKYIPVTFHLVAAANGSGRVTEEAVLQQLASLNVQYADQEAKFYIDRFNYFDNDAVYNSPASNAAKVQMRLRKDNNSINVFITNSADNGGQTPGEVLAYYDTQEDWIVSQRGEINGATNTMAHELGHFFSLPHPFVGWDCHPYTLDEYTNPVNVQFTIPCEGGGGSVLIELHNRTNCNTAGDRICDTPEDYNLGLLYQNNCAENNSVKDINSEVIKPMVNNFMSYYRECDDYEFTQTQKNLINTDFFSIQRAYIRTGVVPNTTPVVDPVAYITPINGEETNGASNILLDWENTPGANRYLLIYDRFASFTFNPQKLIVTSSEYVIPGPLTDNITYFWKVWPFNESMTDAGYSATQSFKVGTGVGVNEIHDISDYALTPNPVTDHVTALLTLSSTKAFSGSLEITDASGHVLSKETIQIPSGLSQFPIQNSDFPAGIYFVVLHSDRGRLVERLLIME